jgi:hypothetical protein
MKNILLTNSIKAEEIKHEFNILKIEETIFSEDSQEKALEMLNNQFLDFIDDIDDQINSIVLDFSNKNINLSLSYSTYLRLSIKHLTNNIPIPIFIISDFSEIEIIKKFYYGNIILTPNIFALKSIEEVSKMLKEQRFEIKIEDFIRNFKQFFSMPTPKNYENHHSTENILAMKEWKKALKFNNKNEDEKDYDLYFQYILSKNLNYKVDIIDLDFLKNYNAKILIIEDQLKEGWRDIFLEIFGEKNEKIKFLGDDFSNKSKKEIIDLVEREIEEFKPNFVITDLRLHSDDFSSNIEEMTGYKLIEKIKTENFGIHIFCMSVTSKAVNLKKLNAISLNEFIPKRFSDTIHPINELIDKFKEYEEIKHISEWVDIINVQRKKLEIFKDSKTNTSVIKDFSDLGKNNDENIIRLKINDIEAFQTYLYIGTKLLSKARIFKNQENFNAQINNSNKIYIESSFLNYFIAFEYIYNFLIDEKIKVDRNNKKSYFINKKTENYLNQYIYDKDKKEYRLKGKYEVKDKKNIDWSNKVLNTFFEINPNGEIKEINSLIKKRNDLIHGSESKINFKDITKLFDLISNLDFISNPTN